MTFESILFSRSEAALVPPAGDPPFFSDLNLDQVADAMFAGRESYSLRPFFRIPLRGVDEVAYRHEVLADLDNVQVFTEIAAFADSMRAIREALIATAKLYYVHERERWILDAASRYREGVERLLRSLNEARIASQGLMAFRDYLENYVRSAGFCALIDDVSNLRVKLASITYSVVIDGGSLNVRAPQDEGDLVVAIHETFARFRQGASKSYLLTFHEQFGMNHIEAKVLEFVALLYPDAFTELDRFAETHAAFIDPVVERFDREIQFYLACLEFARKIESAGLPMCVPKVS